MPSLSPRYNEGSEGSGDEGRDEAHKREWNLFYQKQMRLRKVKGMGAQWGPGGPLLTPSQPLPWGWTGSCLAAGQDALRALMSSSRAKTPR